MSKCKTCKYWKDSLCTHPKIREDWWDEKQDDELIYPYNEGAEHFWAGPEFGCVHHKEKK